MTRFLLIFLFAKAGQRLFCLILTVPFLFILAFLSIIIPLPLLPLPSFPLSPHPSALRFSCHCFILSLSSFLVFIFAWLYTVWLPVPISCLPAACHLCENSPPTAAWITWTVWWGRVNPNPGTETGTSVTARPRSGEVLALVRSDLLCFFPLPSLLIATHCLTRLTSQFFLAHEVPVTFRFNDINWTQGQTA